MTRSPIPMVLRLQNTGDAPIELYLRGRQPAFDISVSDAAGDVVWQRLNGEIIAAILQFKQLHPGEALELAHEWDQRGNRGEAVEPGSYTARGSVLTDGEPLQSAIARFVITPR